MDNDRFKAEFLRTISQTILMTFLLYPSGLWLDELADAGDIFTMFGLLMGIIIGTRIIVMIIIPGPKYFESSGSRWASSFVEMIRTVIFAPVVCVLVIVQATSFGQSMQSLQVVAQIQLVWLMLSLVLLFLYVAVRAKKTYMNKGSIF